ncbi:forkhead box Q2 [Lampris incognitus]|uniref:forkhead box Q2 n=1 Tax=Lampris incognitus TaxID=2546036 RepID=UPI0024B5E6CC|nr:forkhead box Q2 [Lampris incognitus]
MSLRDLNSQMTTEDRSSCTGSRGRLGLSFTIDYLLFNKGVKNSKDELVESRTTEKTVNSKPNNQSPRPKEVQTDSEVLEKELRRSDEENKERKVHEEQREEGEEEVTTTTTTSITSSRERSQDKPTQSYIALISMAILASEEKKLLLCDIYQWIMEHYPYFKSKDKNWRNSVRHNLSLNECFIKVGRSDNGKGHFWAIHPSNYQDFSKGDYHCRRARRRVRRVTGQLPYASLGSPYYSASNRFQGSPCWCCPPSPAPPLPCLSPSFYWGWPGMQTRVGLHSALHTSIP